MDGPLVISYDISSNRDTPVLVIGRRGLAGTITVLNVLTGKDAEDTYNKLVNRRDKRDGE